MFGGYIISDFFGLDRYTIRLDVSNRLLKPFFYSLWDIQSLIQIDISPLADSWQILVGTLITYNFKNICCILFYKSAQLHNYLNNKEIHFLVTVIYNDRYFQRSITASVV